MKVKISGAATTKFGELWNSSLLDLAEQAVGGALDDAGLKPDRIEAIYVGNMLSGAIGGQDQLGAFMSHELGFECGAMKIEGACASGGLAVHAGVTAIVSGLYKNVLVLGVEKMTDHKPEEVASHLMGAGSDSERDAGATFPSLYAMIARSHMAKYGTTEEEMASVAVKNHFHASLNSHAQFVSPITIERVMQSPMVSSPLKLMDCSPISDGAAAVVLSGKRKAESGKLPQVNIIASAVATDSVGLCARKDLTSLDAAVRASRKAYEMANISPQDIDIAEVHDCFTIAEIIAMEDLGIFKKGEAGRAILEDKTKLGGHPVVNTSGGLKACGHPVGATGVKQIVEIYQQLLGRGGKKQVEKARIGLTHNVGGSGATAVIHILSA